MLLLTLSSLVLQVVFGAVLGPSSAPPPALPSEAWIFKKVRAQLDRAHGFSVEVWKLDEKGASPKFTEAVIYDRKRGVRLEGSGGPFLIANKSKVWEVSKDGKTTIKAQKTVDDPGLDCLNLGKDTGGRIIQWDSETSVVTFDGRKCYKLDPFYEEHVQSQSTLYVDVKTLLPAGYAYAWHGQWDHTDSYRHLKLNPSVTAKTFSFPKPKPKALPLAGEVRESANG